MEGRITKTNSSAKMKSVIPLRPAAGCFHEVSSVANLRNNGTTHNGMSVGRQMNKHQMTALDRELLENVFDERFYVRGRLIFFDR